MEKVKCEYCKKSVTKIQLNRHQNTKLCRNKQLNVNVVLPVKEYKCKYCDKTFNRLDNRNEHEDNKSCNASDIITKLEVSNEKLEFTNELLKQKDIEIEYLKSQIQVYRPLITNIGNNNTNITINDCIFVSNSAFDVGINL